jgi:hypothetical protein
LILKKFEFDDGATLYPERPPSLASRLMLRRLHVMQRMRP